MKDRVGSLSLPTTATIPRRASGSRNMPDSQSLSPLSIRRIRRADSTIPRNYYADRMAAWMRFTSSKLGAEAIRFAPTASGNTPIGRAQRLMDLGEIRKVRGHCRSIPGKILMA